MNKKGFTLTELIAAIVILSIIITIGVVTYTEIRKNVLNKQYNNLVTYLETKAGNYANDTGELNVTVEKLIEAGYIDGKIIDPRNGVSLNCYMLESIYENGNYKATIKDSIGENELGKCNAYKVIEQIQVCVVEGNNCNIEFKEWYNQNITLKVLIGNNQELSNKADIVWKYNGKVATDKAITTEVSSINKGLYTVEVKYDDIQDGEVVQHFEGTKTIPINIDRQKPTAKLNRIQNENTWTNYDKKVTVTFSDNNGSGIKKVAIYKVEEGKTCTSSELTWEKYTSSIYTKTLDVGTYKACAMDKAGNISDEMDEEIVIKNIDKNPPTCSYNITGNKSIPTSEWYTDNATLEITATDADSEIVAYGITNTNDKYYNFKNKIIQSSNTDDSGKNYYIWIKDKAGNEADCNVNIKVDKTAPTCTYSGENTTWTTNDVTVTYGCSDSDSGCNTSGGTIPYTTTTKTAYIPKHTIKDKAGNTTLCEVKKVNVYVDKTAPTCTNSGDNTTWTTSDVTINYGCSDNDSGCNASYKGGSTTFSTTTNTASIASYTIKDVAGNTVTCAARTADVYVDKTAPTVTISHSETTKSCSTWNNSKCLFSGQKISATSTSSSSTCAQQVQELQSSYSTSSAIYKLLYSSIMSSCSSSSSSSTCYCKKYSGTEKDWSKTSSEISFTLNDNANVVGYVVTQSSSIPSSNSFSSISGTTSYSGSYSATENGTYYVWAKDSVGNIQKSSVSVANIDKTAPTISTFTMVNGNKKSYNSTRIKLSVTASDSQSGIVAYCFSNTNSSTNCEWQSSTTKTVTEGTEGSGETITYYVFVMDKAGNIASKSASYDIYEACTYTVSRKRSTTGSCKASSGSCGSGTKTITNYWKDKYLSTECPDTTTSESCSITCCNDCSCYDCGGYDPTPSTSTPTACDKSCADQNSKEWHNCTTNCVVHNADGTTTTGTQADLQKANDEIYHNICPTCTYDAPSGERRDADGNCLNCFKN